jgi:hypothetical protein
MAEELMMPRSKRDYEDHLKELQSKYGVKDDGALKSDVVAASTDEPRVGAGLTRSEATTISGRSLKNVTPGSRLRISLQPVGADRFSFDQQSFDAGSLQVELEALAQTYVLDTLVLLEGDAPIQALHLVELSRLSATFKIPALYQRGESLHAVTAALR